MPTPRPAAPPPAPTPLTPQQRFADFKQAQADAVANRGLPQAPPTPGPTPAQQRYAALKQDQVEALANGQSVSEYRQVNTLTSQFAADPAKWDATRRALGLPADAQPTSESVTTALRLSRQLDSAGQQAGDAAAAQREAQLERELFRNPAVAARAQREVEIARNTATYRAQLGVLAGSGRLQVPPGVDPNKWMEQQAAMVGADQRVRGDALARGLNPDEAAQRSSQLYRLQLESALDSGALQQPMTPDQRQQLIDRQMQYHGEAANLAGKLGIPMTDAMGRVQTAHGLIDQRVSAQLQVEDAVNRFDETTTAATRGMERIRGFFGGDGAYHLDQTRADFGRIEGLQSEYNRLVLDNATLTPEQQARKAQLEQLIPQEITAATSRSVETIDASTTFANNARFAEQGLWQAAHLGSAVIPGGPAIMALAKLGLDDLPNGRIRADSAAHFGQDVATSLVEGAAGSYLNKLGLNGAGLSTMALAGAAYSGGTSLLEQARDPNGQGIDGGRLLFDTGIGGLSSFAGGYAGRLPGLVPGAAGNALRSAAGSFAFDRGADLVTGAGFNALDQYATTGQVDPRLALRAGVENGILGGLDSAAQQGLQSRMPRPGMPADPAAPSMPLRAPGAEPAGPRAPLTPEETQHAADLLMTIARRAQIQQSQQELMGPFTPWGTAAELQSTRGEVGLLNQQLGTVGMDPSTPAGREALRNYLGGANPETDALLGALDKLPGDKPWTPRMDLPAGAPTEDALHQAQLDALRNANASYDRWAVDQIARGNFDVQPLVDNLGREAGLAHQRMAEQGYDPAQHPQGAFVPPGTVQPRSASERAEIDLQTGAVLDISARRLEILQQQRDQLGVRAPSALDVQIADEIANIERNRVQREAIGAPLPPHLQQQLAELPRGADAFAPWHQEMMASRLDGVQNPEEVAHQLAMYELYRQHQAFYQGLPDRVTQAVSSGSLPPPAPPAPSTPRSPMSRQLGLPLQNRMVQMQLEVRNLLRVAQASR